MPHRAGFPRGGRHAALSTTPRPSPGFNKETVGSFDGAMNRYLSPWMRYSSDICLMKVYA